MALLLALLALSRVDDAPEPTYPEHLRFGIGIISGATELKSLEGDRMAPTLLGADVRIGLRFSDSFAVMYDGSVTTVVPQLSSGVLIEWTPFVFVSGAIGAAFNWIPWVPNGGSSDWAFGVGVPIRLALNVPLRNEHGDERRRRDAITFSFTATPGYSVAGTAAFQNEFQIGFMGGVSFEMY